MPESPITNPNEALSRLLEGNERFATDQPVYPNLVRERRDEVALGQSPFATVVGCSDSRVPIELIFDRGLGDIFVLRTAGQVGTNASLGTIQFGVLVLNIPLLMVLGHQGCGAVAATIQTLDEDGDAPGAIYSLVSAIGPAVQVARAMAGDLLTNAIEANVRRQVAQYAADPLLARAVAAGKLRIVGAVYHLGDGRVALLDG